MSVYALNLFNVASRDEYREYSLRSAAEVEAHGGRVVALGKFRREVTGDIAPRQVLILVEWVSEAAFESYRNDAIENVPLGKLLGGVVLGRVDDLAGDGRPAALSQPVGATEKCRRADHRLNLREDRVVGCVDEITGQRQFQAGRKAHSIDS